MKKREIFKIEGNNIKRERKHCPKCGPGVFLAEHKDRLSCGKCGYTEFKGSHKRTEKPLEEKKIEVKKEKPTEKSSEEQKENKE